MQDLIIENGRVVDCQSNTDRIANVWVKDGRITHVGPESDNAAEKIDASGLLVVPGIIDSHMHASNWLAGAHSYKMLALAGVTTALEMAGPLEDVKAGVRNHGSGICIGCLEMIRPVWNVSSASPSEEELTAVINDAMRRGAFGVKLLGGHYPLTPEAASRLIALCDKKGVYLAVHAGSTEHGSNIEGVKEVVECAEGHAFHLAHTNAYCRGAIKAVEDEIAVVAGLLKTHPEIDSESYLSAINGCSGKCVNGIPESGITRNCLKSRGYEASEGGLRKAIADGFAMVHARRGDIVELAGAKEGLEIWLTRNTDAPMSFPVNPSLSGFYFATQKRPGGQFLSDSFCTDGGGIPRNVIVEHGLSLVKFGALSIKEFVFKSSTSAARLLGLASKGTLTEGADADITVLDFDKQKAVHALSMGRPTLLEGCAVGHGGTILTTERGKDTLLSEGFGARTADIGALFDYRRHRFEH